MTMVIIEEDSFQAEQFIRFTRTLPFVKVVETRKKSYEEACAECGAVTVDAFFDELNARIEKWPDYA